jgi:hypothetical protein
MNKYSCIFLTIQTLNMCLRVISSGEGIKSTPKCLIKRGVRRFLPPPSGAQAAVNVTSSMSFQKSLSRSYKPWKSKYCLHKITTIIYDTHTNNRYFQNIKASSYQVMSHIIYLFNILHLLLQQFLDYVQPTQVTMAFTIHI